MWTWGVVSALIHFICVEMRPLLLLSTSIRVLTLEVVKDRYLARENAEESINCNCGPLKSESHFVDALKGALESLELEYHYKDECVDLHFDGDNYGTIILAVLNEALIIVFLVDIFQFFRVAWKAENFSFRGGGYFTFTMRREDMRPFRIVLSLFLFVVSVCAAVSMFLIIKTACERGESVQKAVEVSINQNLEGLLVFALSTYHLLSPVDDTEFRTWDLEKLRKVTFKRRWFRILTRSNDALYQDLCQAKLASTHTGGKLALDGLCADPESEAALEQAMGADNKKWPDLSSLLT